MHDQFGPIRKNVISKVNELLEEQDKYEAFVSNYSDEEGNFVVFNVRRRGSTEFISKLFSVSFIRSNSAEIRETLTYTIYAIALGIMQYIEDEEALDE